MINVISVKFKGGGKSYYFAPCSQQLEKGMGVIVETSKGLEYATVTEGLHAVEEDQVVPPLMPVVRIATQKDLEQMEKNEARKGEAMQIVKEKIAARGLDMKPVGCEFSFDCTKIIVYFTSENRVDFRELIKDLSSAFHMRIELRQIGIREEIKLMGGLAPCGRECCCVRSLQEPKKVSVKMAKNQGLSLNPGKISGLCGRLMCCLSYENDFYAEVCKKVPKLGSEATTPDGKGMVVNVNMLKMIVKVKIEQGESVTYKDFPLDKISFMRGNEVIGTVGGEDEEELLEEAVAEHALQSYEKQPVSVGGADGANKGGERKHGDNGGERRNGLSGANQNGGQANQNGGKNRHKNRNKNRSERGQDVKIEQGASGKGGNQNAQSNKQNFSGGRADANQNGKLPHQGGQNGQANDKAVQNVLSGSNQDGQQNNRNRKKHRGNKNRVKANAEQQKNNS
ncbi:MAG: regulatory iron-sulfur-containing complex subunit RicT [Candidatus Coproplasma sp.]